jgi:hypothetical protein
MLEVVKRALCPLPPLTWWLDQTRTGRIRLHDPPRKRRTQLDQIADLIEQSLLD